jgi:hypothetical protein
MHATPHLADRRALCHDQAAQAQVRDARAAVGGQQDVGALDVQVRDAVAVQEAQAARDVQRDFVPPAGCNREDSHSRLTWLHCTTYMHMWGCTQKLENP